MDTMRLAREYQKLRHDGESDADAAAIVDAMMIGAYLESNHQGRAQTQKHNIGSTARRERDGKRVDGS